MKERILRIIENENMTPSAFADYLQIGRAVISHILNGRNNPSLDVVTRILTKMSYINSEWLLTGNGDMYKSGYSNSENNNSIYSSNIIPDLFSQNNVNEAKPIDQSVYLKENIVNEPLKEDHLTVKQSVIADKRQDRKVDKIIIYYSDNTFEVFQTGNKSF